MEWSDITVMAPKWSGLILEWSDITVMAPEWSGLILKWSDITVMAPEWSGLILEWSDIIGMPPMAWSYIRVVWYYWNASNGVVLYWSGPILLECPQWSGPVWYMNCSIENQTNCIPLEWNRVIIISIELAEMPQNKNGELYYSWY